VDVSETSDKITVKAEIPGMEAKDIEISMVGDTLTIKGEKKAEREEKMRTTIWSSAPTAPSAGP
jgi:HSP20 family protein